MNSRIMCEALMLKRNVAYIPGNGRTRKQREKFWKDLNFLIKCCENKGRLVARAEQSEVKIISGKNGVLSVNAKEES